MNHDDKSVRRQKITESWDKFATSVCDLAEAEWDYSKSQVCQYFKLPLVIEKYPLKVVGLAFVPAIFYLIFFNFFSFWQRILGVPTKPWIHLPSVEYKIFGCNPHQIFARYTSPLFDAIAALPYLVHFFLVLMYPPYCYLNRKRLGSLEPALRSLWCGGIVCSVSVLTQLFLPTAPPWFNESAVYDAEGKLLYSAFNEAGFQRLDAYYGYYLFHEMYSKSPITYGSFPSLHVAFPTVILMNGSWISWKFGLIHVCLISWAALYSHHHYLVDVIGGILLTFFTYQIYYKVWNPFQRFNTSFTRKLSDYNKIKMNNKTDLMNL